MGIVEIDLRRLHLRLVGENCGLVLGDQRLLILDLLAGDRILLVKRFITSKIALMLSEQRLVLGELALRLGQRRLIGPGVDLRDEVALFDHLAFRKSHRLQLARDLGADGDGLEGRHRSERVDRDRHIPQRHRRDPHRLWRRPGAPGPCPFGRRGFGVLESSARRTPPQRQGRSTSAIRPDRLRRWRGTRLLGRRVRASATPEPTASPGPRARPPRV